MKRRMAACFLVCAACFVQAQDTSYISLETILQQAEANYPSIIQYQYNMDALRARAEGAKSWMPPTFTTGIMRFPYDLSMIKEKNEPMNEAGLAFSIEQMIPGHSKLNAKKNYVASLSEIELFVTDIMHRQI